MIEGKNPLAACYQSAIRSHKTLDTTKVMSLKLFQAAWDAFSRLLNLNFAEIFKCLSCGDLPDVVVCDSTILHGLHFQLFFVNQRVPSHYLWT